MKTSNNKLLVIGATLACLLVFHGNALGGLNDGLVAYYPFNGNANDASGNGNDGTPVNVSYVTDRFGQIGYAGYFDGSGYVSVPYSPVTDNLSSNLTLSAWIKIDQGAQYSIYGYLHILSKGAIYANRYADYAMGLSNPGDNLPAGSLQFENSPSWDAQNYLGSGFKISEGIWHHVSITFTSPSVRFYCDGVLVATVNSPAPLIRTSTEPLYIGCRYLNPLVGGFTGAIDEVRIYNRALSAAEILQLYDTTPTLVCPNLVGTWSGQVNIADSRGGYRAATLSVQVTDQNTNECLLRGYLKTEKERPTVAFTTPGASCVTQSCTDTGNARCKVAFTGTIQDETSVALNFGSFGQASAILDLSQTPPALTKFILLSDNGDTAVGRLTKQTSPTLEPRR